MHLRIKWSPSAGKKHPSNAWWLTILVKTVLAFFVCIFKVEVKGFSPGLKGVRKSDISNTFANENVDHLGRELKAKSDKAKSDKEKTTKVKTKKSKSGKEKDKKESDGDVEEEKGESIATQPGSPKASTPATTAKPTASPTPAPTATPTPAPTACKPEEFSCDVGILDCCEGYCHSSAQTNCTSFNKNKVAYTDCETDEDCKGIYSDSTSSFLETCSGTGFVYRYLYTMCTEFLCDYSGYAIVKEYISENGNCTESTCRKEDGDQLKQFVYPGNSPPRVWCYQPELSN